MFISRWLHAIDKPIGKRSQEPEDFAFLRQIHPVTSRLPYADFYFQLTRGFGCVPRIDSRGFSNLGENKRLLLILLLNNSVSNYLAVCPKNYPSLRRTPRSAITRYSRSSIPLHSPEFKGLQTRIDPSQTKTPCPPRSLSKLPAESWCPNTSAWVFQRKLFKRLIKDCGSKINTRFFDRSINKILLNVDLFRRCFPISTGKVASIFLYQAVKK